jgi:hypothetical protein
MEPHAKEPRSPSLLPWNARLFCRKCCNLKNMFWVFGYICIAIAWTLTLATLHVYYSVVFPLLVDLRSWPGKVMFVPATWLSFNILFNYAMVIVTAPGKPTGSLTDEEQKQMESEKAPEKGQGWSRYCKHCKTPKPPRTHHCVACGQCVLKMDHHCPWIGQCVGHYNHRYFVLFIVYLGTSCLWACLTIGLRYYGVLKSTQNDEDSLTGLLFTFAVCAAVLFAMFTFFLWNAFLLVTNQTTIEYHYNKSKRDHLKTRGMVWANPYDLGTTRNLQQIFGPFKSPWAILLPSVERLPTDGSKWATIHDDTELLL